LRIVWTRPALADRGAIFDHILDSDPLAAARIDQLFSDAADRLAMNPRLGAVGKVAGTRELIPHASYRLVYEIGADEVRILAVVHKARRWPTE
jgi:addiction module RelE/StbE family toxin